jgi:hypothetical protein
VIGGRRGEHLGLVAELDEPYPEAVRKPLDEPAHRGDSGVEPGRFHVAGAHRAGDVDEQHDRRVVHPNRELRPRLRSRGGGESQAQQEKTP